MKKAARRYTTGETIPHMGEAHTIVAVCRGEGQARSTHRRHPGSVYVVKSGQWLVLKRQIVVPDYVLD